MNEQEITAQLRQVYRDGYYSNNNTDKPEFEAHVTFFTNLITEYGNQRELEGRIDELIRSSAYVNNQQDVDSILARHEKLTALQAKETK